MAKLILDIYLSKSKENSILNYKKAIISIFFLAGETIIPNNADCCATKTNFLKILLNL